MTVNHHRFMIGVGVLAIVGLTDFIALYLAAHIEWKSLPGPEAGIISSIITSVITGTLGLGAAVVGHYFGSTPSNDALPPPVLPSSPPSESDRRKRQPATEVNAHD
jgi:hypothetical protein